MGGRVNNCNDVSFKPSDWSDRKVSYSYSGNWLRNSDQSAATQPSPDLLVDVMPYMQQKKALSTSGRVQFFHIACVVEIKTEVTKAYSL